MISIQKYTETKNSYLVIYSYDSINGERKKSQFVETSKRKAMLRYADNCRWHIITHLETNGIKTNGLHNLEISSFLSRVYWIENSIRRQVNNSLNVFQACRQIRMTLQKINEQKN